MKTIPVSTLAPGAYFDKPVFLDDTYLLLSPDAPVTPGAGPAPAQVEVRRGPRRRPGAPGARLPRGRRRRGGAQLAPQTIDEDIRTDEQREAARAFCAEAIAFVAGMFETFAADGGVNIGKATEWVKHAITTVRDNRDFVMRYAWAESRHRALADPAHDALDPARAADRRFPQGPAGAPHRAGQRVPAARHRHAQAAGEPAPLEGRPVGRRAQGHQRPHRPRLPAAQGLLRGREHRPRGPRAPRAHGRFGVPARPSRATGSRSTRRSSPSPARSRPWCRPGRSARRRSTCTAPSASCCRRTGSSTTSGCSRPWSSPCRCTRSARTCCSPTAARAWWSAPTSPGPAAPRAGARRSAREAAPRRRCSCRREEAGGVSVVRALTPAEVKELGRT